MKSPKKFNPADSKKINLKGFLDELPVPSEDEIGLKTFEGSNIGLVNVSDFIKLANTTSGPNHIVFAKSEESRLFFDVVLPLAYSFAGPRRLVVCSLDSNIVLGKDDLPLILLNAEKISEAEFAKFCRLESPKWLGDYLRDIKRPAFIHIRNIGRSKVKLKRLLSGMLDGCFGGFDSINRIEATRIILTGVFGDPGIGNWVDFQITSRCAVIGVDWTND